MPEKSRLRLPSLGFAALMTGLAILVWALRPWDDPLVVYCAHDAEFADAILQEFQRETGIRVAVQYDTEASKSLGLVQRLKVEKGRPRCDVFWNNELLGTVDLQQAGVLEAYRGSGHERIPEQFKDPDGYWTGFAARLRVWIVNTDKQSPDEAELERKLADDADLSHAAIAQPLHGTTLTHYTLLWHEWGPERLKAWHRDTRRRGLREVAGNSQTRNLVADGACAFAFTDTDDYFGARDAKKTVAMVPVQVAGRTICIPNTVSIVKGSRKVDAARKLVDFLLSAETELALARSESRQIPLGPVAAPLPADVSPLAEWARAGADLRPLLPARLAVIDWLKSELLQ
jgi:iron(III) transport system substrate-binding protein